MKDKNLPEHITKLIKYMDENVPVDGMYKVTILKTVSEYYNSLVQAESMQIAISNMFSKL